MARPIINADTAAGVAGAIGASRLLMLTDVAGVRDKNGAHISRLKLGEARALIKDGTVQGGMVPKVETCIEAVEKGAEAAVVGWSCCMPYWLSCLPNMVLAR